MKSAFDLFVVDNALIMEPLLGAVTFQMCFRKLAYSKMRTVFYSRQLILPIHV